MGADPTQRDPDAITAENRANGLGEVERTALTNERVRAQLEAVVNQLPVGLVIVDASSERVLTMNDEAARIMAAAGGSAEALPLERVLVRGEAVQGERLELDHPEHGSFTLFVSAAPVRDRSGQIVSAVATIQDVTASELRERAEREFVTNAAHELQSPLAAITSAVEVLQAGAKDTKDRDLFLEHIDREALRLGRVVRSLLTLARTQTGVESARAEVLVVAPLLEAIAERMEPAEGVEISVDCPSDLAVLANRDLLEQAISNLVRNAVKYTAEGSIRLTGGSRDGQVEIGVADTGIGIPADSLPRVFDRFYKGDAQHEGFGLGLSIVQASVGVMGGELEIDSSPGRGTTVTITLPSGAKVVRS
jgi:signal transduction histidine kinase